MSSQQPNSQPPRQPSARKSQPTAQTSNSFIKTQTIKVLRGTIRRLEGLAVKLESQPATRTTPSFLEKLQLGWRGVLAKIRIIIPQNLSLKLSTTVLTAIILGVVAIAAVTTVTLAQAPQVAIIPPTVPEQPPPINPPSESVEPEPVIPAKISEPVIQPTPTPTVEPKPVTPAEIFEPVIPQPTSTPTVELTPEQNLIAAIENQVAEISDRYGDGISQSVQVNFPANSLTVKVANNWYTLKKSQQDKLAARMFQRAKELDFIHLKIIDQTGTLLARNPVVGKDMVILKRQA